LKLISNDQLFVIEAVDDTRFLTLRDIGVFRNIRYDDPQDITLKAAIIPSVATKKTIVQVYELNFDATFKEMFCSFNVSLDSLCLTQHQIITFCEKHYDWLCRDGYATFFLVKVASYYLVADVNVFSYDNCNTDLRLRSLDCCSVWDGRVGSRIVVPLIK
jgi:hypothetical protein